jgi:hypothetical protein
MTAVLNGPPSEDALRHIRLLDAITMDISRVGAFLRAMDRLNWDERDRAYFLDSAIEAVERVEAVIRADVSGAPIPEA